jgi:hypothetical protein
MTQRTKTTILAGLLTAGVALTGGLAYAFPFPYVWTDSASGVGNNPTGNDKPGRAGSENIFYTGAPSPGKVKNVGDYNMGCEVCHVAKADDGTPLAQGQFGQISASFAGLPANNKYTPGMQYTITISMVGELHTGPGSGMGGQHNGVNITVRNASGALTGVIASDVGNNNSNNAPTACPQASAIPAGATTFVCGPATNRALISVPVLASAPSVALTAWKFRWTAPAAGAGNATIYYSMVDGNHVDKSSYGDDVKTGTIVLAEGP